MSSARWTDVEADVASARRHFEAAISAVEAAERFLALVEAEVTRIRGALDSPGSG